MVLQWGASNSGNTLDGVSVNGDLDLTRGERLLIRNGLTLTGTMRLNNNASVSFEGTQTFATGTVEFAGDSGILGLTGPASMTLGPGVGIHGKTGSIGPTLFFGGTQSLINQGLISADMAGGTLTINPGQFNNSGTVQAIAAGSSVIIRVNAFTNTGTIQELNGGNVLSNP